MNKVIKSSSLLIFQRLMQRSLGIVSTIILARLLTPDDFGIVAIAMLVLWFSQTLSDASTEAFILQQKKVRKIDLNSAWTLDLILKSCAYMFMLALAPHVAQIKNLPELTAVISVTGLLIVLESLKNPIFMIYKRRQKYEAIIKLTIYAKVISLFISIPIALIYKSYWAVILAAIFAEIFLAISSYKISNYRPKLSIEKISAQWNFSKWLIPRSIIGYFRNHLDTLLVSNAYTNAELGAYNNLKYFASIPMLQFLAPLIEPLHTELGKVSDNKGEIRYQSDLTIRALSIIGSIIIGFLYVNSELIIRIVLGEQWTQYSTMFSLFSLLTIPFIFINQSFRILMIENRTNYIFIYEAISTILIALFLVTAINFSIENFIIVKVLVESILSVALYCYTYKTTFELHPALNVTAFFLFTGAAILLTKWASESFVFSQITIIELAANVFISALIFVVFFLIFYNTLISERERNLIKVLAKSMVQNS